MIGSVGVIARSRGPLKFKAFAGRIQSLVSSTPSIPVKLAVAHIEEYNENLLMN